MDEEKALVVFQGKDIRRIWHDGQWYFSVVDVIAALTESPTPRQYWGKLKDRAFIDLELSPIWVQLKLEAQDGKLRSTDCANTESLFRVIQSIPSKKAEPFKQWLAKIGYERVQEIEDPELAQRRMKELYQAKGYSEEWIEKRVRGIAIRDELTDEWQNRGVQYNKPDFEQVNPNFLLVWNPFLWRVSQRRNQLKKRLPVERYQEMPDMSWRKRLAKVL